MSEAISQLTDSNFEGEVISSEKPVLVDFWAVWCGPCKMIAPELKKLSEEKSGELKIGRLNVDDNRDIAIKYGISSIPTLLLFKNGEVVKKLIGAMSKDKILTEIGLTPEEFIQIKVEFSNENNWDSDVVCFGSLSYCCMRRNGCSRRDLALVERYPNKSLEEIMKIYFLRFLRRSVIVI